MSDWQQDVAQFMIEVKELDLPRQPVDAAQQPPLIRNLCKSLMYEELNELEVAINQGDLVSIADGIADLIYVALYTANAYGLWMEPIFAEVQRSNMTKKGGPMRPDGKQLKPPGYEPPDLKTIVEGQMYRPLAYKTDAEGQDNPVAWQNPQTGRIIQE